MTRPTFFNRVKLRMLAHMLSNHDFYFPNVRFDLSGWVEQDATKKTCGSAACAVGSAIYWKPFQLLGLKPKTSGGFFGEVRYIPKYKDEENWDAVTKFFGIDLEIARWLFEIDKYPENDPQPEAVVERIREVLDGSHVA